MKSIKPFVVICCLVSILMVIAGSFALNLSIENPKKKSSEKKQDQKIEQINPFTDNC